MSIGLFVLEKQGRQREVKFAGRIAIANVSQIIGREKQNWSRVLTLLTIEACGRKVRMLLLLTALEQTLKIQRVRLMGLAWTGETWTNNCAWLCLAETRKSATIAKAVRKANPSPMRECEKIQFPSVQKQKNF